MSRLSLEPAVSSVTWQIVPPDLRPADDGDDGDEPPRPTSRRWLPWARSGRP